MPFAPYSESLAHWWEFGLAKEKDLIWHLPILHCMKISRGKLIFNKRFATKWDSEKQQNEMLDMKQNWQQSYLNQNVTFRNLLSTKWLAVLSTKYLKTYNEERGMGSEHVVKGNPTCMGLQECYRQVRAFGAIYWQGSAVRLWHCWADRLKLEFGSVGFF